ncbi:hypothetical protein NDU88_002893, partial [Pleurodeles waltl]
MKQLISRFSNEFETCLSDNISPQDCIKAFIAITTGIKQSLTVSFGKPRPQVDKGWFDSECTQAHKNLKQYLQRQNPDKHE